MDIMGSGIYFLTNRGDAGLGRRAGVLDMLGMVILNW